ILLLAVIFGQAVPGWRRRALATPPHAPIDLHSGQPVSLPADQQPVSVWDLVSRHLLSRQIFTLVLALVLWFPVMSRLVHCLFGVLTQFNDLHPPQALKFSVCSVALPGICYVGFAWELWALNILIAVFGLATGIFVLAARIQAEFMQQPTMN